ncbi:MAG: hypothetical protein KBC95_02555 [Candidatus Peribacteraceae bacterium]|nr:hypothetical protein [Candidatus Peribacteraceae bacterium]
MGKLKTLSGLTLDADPPEGFLQPESCEVKSESKGVPAIYVDNVRHQLQTRLADNPFCKQAELRFALCRPDKLRLIHNAPIEVQLRLPDKEETVSVMLKGTLLEKSWGKGTALWVSDSHFPWNLYQSKTGLPGLICTKSPDGDHWVGQRLFSPRHFAPHVLTEILNGRPMPDDWEGSARRFVARRGVAELQNLDSILSPNDAARAAHYVSYV